MNPIGVNSWVWVSPPTNESIAELAPRVKAMGFDLLELGVENPGDWDPARVAEILAASNLGASVCAAMGPGRDLTDPTTIASTQAYVRVCIDAVVALGGAVVAGPLYTPVGKTWKMDDAERAAAIDRLVEGLRPLADYAGERGVRLAIEPLNRFETSFLNTAAQTIEVVDRVDSPAVGVLLDTFHMNIEEKDQAAALPVAATDDAIAEIPDRPAWEDIDEHLGGIGVQSVDSGERMDDDRALVGDIPGQDLRIPAVAAIELPDASQTLSALYSGRVLCHGGRPTRCAGHGLAGLPRARDPRICPRQEEKR
jgi:D-psicose/D-tagatose/L-ribulose 3-epimerase